MRRGLAFAALAIGFTSASAGLIQAGAAPSLYRIDQRYGSIEFTVSSLGLFTTEGRFGRFEGELLLDPDNPEQTRVDVRVDADSVEMPLANETELLRSPAYFDTAQHRMEHFVSTSIEPLSPAHYRIHGTLELRGVANPIELDAVVRNRHFDQAHGVEVADFDIGGRLRRSVYGMRADQVMVSDVVKLDIHLHLTVAVGPKSG